MVCVGTLAVLLPATAVRALHSCDPADEEGWTVSATEEFTAVKDGAPYQAGADWFVDRVTTLLPMCNYFNAVGNYSLRSYSLDPHDQTERIAICHAGAAVKPYAGKCPPR
jgi:hypothetical protein